MKQYKELSKKYNTCESNIYFIKAGLTWKETF